jgi:thioredoxin 1
MKKALFGLVAVLGLAGLAAVTAQDTMMKVESYAPYSVKAFTEASKLKRVLFFAASWCPSCRSVDKDITENIKLIPADTVIFKTDYDTETALKSKYLITRQHTFVWVDAKGAVIKKWSGGGASDVAKAVTNVK